MTNYTKEILDIIKTQTEQNSRTLSLMEKLVNLPETETQTVEEEVTVPVQITPQPKQNRRITFGDIRRMTDWCLDMRNSLIANGTWTPVKVDGQWTITEDEFLSVTGLASSFDTSKVYFYAPRTIEKRLDLPSGSISDKLISMANRGEIDAVFLGNRRRYPAEQMDALIAATLEGRATKPNKILIMDDFRAAAKEMKK